MIAALIGISSGLLVIMGIAVLKQLDKTMMYGLILCAIGFLYIGFTWTNLEALFLTSFQAIFFLLLGYFGMTRNRYFLIAGYFLHGLWDFAYDLFPSKGLIPPNYDWFCLSIDFTMGAYLLLIHKQGKLVFP